MIVKYSLFDIGGDIVSTSDTSIVRENNELNNIWVNSILLFKEKSTKTTSFLDQDCIALFVDGRGILEIKDEIVHVGSNDIVLIPQNTMFRVINTGDIHLRFLLIKERL